MADRALTRWRRADSRRDATGLGAWLSLAGLWSVGVVAALVLSGTASRAERGEVQVDGPTSIAVGAREDDARRAVTIRLVQGDTTPVRTQATGTFTAVEVSAGDVLTDGMRVGEVDGVAVHLLVADTPVFRALGLGDSGPDVRVVSEYLRDLGFLSESDVSDRVGRATRLAIGTFQTSIGAEVDGVFRPEYTAFAPPVPLTVHEVLQTIGEATEPGTVLLELAAAVEAVIVEPAAEGESLAAFTGAPTELAVGTDAVSLAQLPVADDEIAAVAELLDRGVQSGGVLVADGADPAYSGVLATLASPVVRGVVPTTALLGADDGSLCLVETSGSGTGDTSGPGLEVRRLPTAPVVPGELGLSFVPADMIGIEVVRDPARLATEARARCR